MATLDADALNGCDHMQAATPVPSAVTGW